MVGTVYSDRYIYTLPVPPPSPLGANKPSGARGRTITTKEDVSGHDSCSSITVDTLRDAYTRNPSLLPAPRLELTVESLGRAKDYKHNLCMLVGQYIVQELCESRGGRPGLSVLTSLLVSVDVKNY